MITNNTDIEKLIYDEIYRSYPELFSRLPLITQDKENYFDSVGLLSSLFSGFDALPPYLKDRRSTPLPTSDAPAKPYPPYDISRVRSEFPILDEQVNGKNLIWFDNAATTQKPQCVIDRVRYFYEHENSNVHRAAHTLARRTTEAYEGARRTIASFIGALRPDTVIFVRGATEGINLVAQTYGLTHVAEGDEILITELEHHANIVPWQLLCKKTGAALKVIPVDGTGQVLLDAYRRLLTKRTKIVAFTLVSNVLGTITPVEEMVRLAHSAGAKVVLDGAQAAAHLPVDVTALDADFYVFSGHKIFGPTGIGVLFGKEELLETMPPYQGGGNMISDVTMEETRFKKPPHKFEAGTGSIADAIGLGCAVSYVSQLGLDAVSRYENALLDYAARLIAQLPEITVIGNAASKSGIISFHVNHFDSDTLASLLDREGIAVRAGHHCAQPILRRFGCDKIVRASFALYNTFEEIDIFLSVLRRISVR